MWHKQHQPEKLWKGLAWGTPDMAGQAHLARCTAWPLCSPTQCWPRPGCGPPPRLAPGAAASIASTHFLWARVTTQVAFVLRIAHTLALLSGASGRLCNIFKHGALSSTTHATRSDKSAHLVILKPVCCRLMHGPTSYVAADCHTCRYSHPSSPEEQGRQSAPEAISRTCAVPRSPSSRMSVNAMRRCVGDSRTCAPTGPHLVSPGHKLSACRQQPDMVNLSAPKLEHAGEWSMTCLLCGCTRTASSKRAGFRGDSTQRAAQPYKQALYNQAHRLLIRRASSLKRRGQRTCPTLSPPSRRASSLQSRTTSSSAAAAVPAPGAPKEPAKSIAGWRM